MSIATLVPRHWQNVSLVQKLALWQAPLIFVLSLEIGLFMWLFWLSSWAMSSVKKIWVQLPILAGLIALTGQLVPLKSADFFILMLVILLPFTWRIEDKAKASSDADNISPAGLCPTIFLAGSVFIFQSQFIVLLGLVAWLLSFLMWFATALTGFRLTALSVRWIPILAGSLATAGMIILLFTTIPRLSTGFIPSFATASSQIGLTDELSPGGLSDLLASQDVAFRAIPATSAQPAPRYWRVFTLSEQRGNGWQRARDNKEQNNFVITDDGQEVRYQILTDTHDLTDIPMAGWPGSSAHASISGFRYNRYGEARLNDGQDTRQVQISSSDTVSHGYDYPRSTALGDANPRLQNYARQLRKAFRDEDAFITAIMRKFSDEFLYDTSITLPEKDALDAFFFDSKVGFCSYFATSLATILRASGMDAHVVTGYMGGEWNQFGNYWLVKQSDAHAWVEVRLQDGTWRRLDPTLQAMQLSTPRFQGLSDFGETQVDGRALVTRRKGDLWDKIEQGVAFMDSLNLRVTLAIMNYGDSTDKEVDSQNNEDNFALLLAALGLGVTIIFVIVGIMRLSSLSATGRPSVERRLEKLIALYTTPRLMGESLVEHAHKIAALDEQVRKKAVMLAHRVYQMRFSSQPWDNQSIRAIHSDIRALRAALRLAKKALRS